MLLSRDELAVIKKAAEEIEAGQTHLSNAAHTIRHQGAIELLHEAIAKARWAQVRLQDQLERSL